MSKCLILADLHAGVRSDSDIFLKNFEDLFGMFLPKIIIDNSVSKVFILGDIFDNRNYINGKTLYTVLTTFKKFLKSHLEIEVYLLIGNHDLYYKNTREINSLKILEDKYSNVHIISEVTRKRIFNRDVVLCPWVIDKTDLEAVFKDPADLCLGHFEINGFEMISGFKESNGLSQSLFNTKFKLTFSGHFHVRNEEGRIIYVGNPYQLTWNDCGMDKGVYLLDFDTLDYRFIENTSAPKFKRIYLSQIKKKTIDIRAEICHNFIRLVLDEEVSSDILDKLNYIISGLNPLSFEVVDDIKNFGDIIVSDDANGPIEFLHGYVDVMPLDEKTEREVLKRKIEELYQTVET